MTNSSATPQGREELLARIEELGGDGRLQSLVDELEAENKTDEGREPKSLPPKRIALLAFSAVVAGVVFALLLNFFLLPALEKAEAEKALEAIGASSGPLRPVNTELVTYRGSSIENVNIEQKALTSSGSPDTPPGFIFGNGKDFEKTLEVYVDFSSQGSRDFILMNQTVLRNLVESGKVQLAIYPVPTGNAFSLYSSEAIAESVVTNPDLTWDFMLALLKNSVGFTSNKNEDYLNLVSTVAEDVGVARVDEESIKNGTFASWLISVSDDPRLATGFYPPVIYVDGVLMETTQTSINDPEAFLNEVLS